MTKMELIKKIDEKLQEELFNRSVNCGSTVSRPLEYFLRDNDLNFLEYINYFKKYYKKIKR